MLHCRANGKRDCMWWMKRWLICHAQTTACCSSSTLWLWRLN
jgi:hypothetical protein